jgi:peptidoglycan/LPS O-acetylase OafA/YrhL
MVVPGGWSIGVEFTFYMIFPLLAWRIRSMRAAWIGFAAAVLIGMAANTFALPRLHALYGEVATSNFLYFWFPNQLPIFMLGMVLYHAIEHFRQAGDTAIAVTLRRWHYPAVALCLLVLVGLAEQTSYRVGILSLAPLHPLPILMLASLVFMVFCLVLFLNPTIALVNRAICALGEVSFSAYLLHFVVLHQLTARLPGVFDTTATGYAAILACAALWAVAVPITFGCSLATYRGIEQPMIRLGRLLLERRAKLRLAGAD